MRNHSAETPCCTPMDKNVCLNHLHLITLIRKCLLNVLNASSTRFGIHGCATCLLLRSKWFKPRENLKNGDYVIVLKPGLKGQSAPRGLWEHAIVVNTFPGSDGRVRKVELRLSGQRKLFRPIHKLCLLATAEELCDDGKEKLS